MTLSRICSTLCFVAGLSIPLMVFADDGGGDDNSQSTSPVVTSSTGNQSGNQNGDDHGGDQNNNVNNNNGDDNNGNEGVNQDQNNNAGVGQNNDQVSRTRLTLAATVVGGVEGAEGNVDIRVKGNEQRIKIEVEANVADGTIFQVMANGIPIGIITIHLQEGELEFETQNGQTLPGKLLPGAITSIVVTDAKGSIVLQAQFGPLQNNGPVAPPVALIRKDQPLVPTMLGKAAGSQGTVDLRAQGAIERLKVEVDANVLDGVTWKIFANKTIPIGTLAFHLQEAELQLETGVNMLPAGLSSLSSITLVQVTDPGGNVMLSATL